ncbi:AAA family ATPase [Solitalea sp. MAHUQ-68]|uniref:AAA family ATPase n=1 Tax=Solitalea agri TaxID=2953739 RepID=A0A9X2F3R7_9SPHI|nr:AAA family ATPase [Solitalea agri]MCO4294224.1 AAA family ATPase [Solitalea agri]
MVKAFVFGKFLPFHTGHEALIRFALSKCDFLTVLVCCSDKEAIDGSLRKSWIEESFADHKILDIRIMNYNEDELPNTSVSSREVSKVWSDQFKVLLPDYNLLITSEPYGDYVAEFMGIKHICFDRERKMVPVSATAIRNNTVANWNFLSKGAKPFFCVKVVLLGTESTGKSTIANKLAQHYACSIVAETGRDLIPDSKTLVYDDLVLVADEHAKRITDAVAGDNLLVIIDTDVHITKSYSRFIFNKELKVDADIMQANQAHLYLYLNNDATYFQDGTRLEAEARDRLDLSHRKILGENNIRYVEIKGNWTERFEKACECIDELLSRESKRIKL